MKRISSALLVLFAALCSCGPRQPLAGTVWLNPVTAKLDPKIASGLKADLEGCANTAPSLPRSCKASDDYITKSKPDTNCHWSCGPICKEKNECLWEVTAGNWSLDHAALTATIREANTSCGSKWQPIFDDPREYEQPSCKQECLQMAAVVALSRVDPACAMNIFGIVARRPHCIGDIPHSCRQSGVLTPEGQE